MKKEKTGYYILGLARVGIGLIFLWAFFDKLIGLGFTTCRDGASGVISIMCDGAWLNGGSPTTGFLSFATKGPFAGFFQSMAGNVLVDWLFMIGLLVIGLTLTFGILVRLGSASGALMLFLMWLAVLLPEHHPFLDDHIIYALVLLSFLFINIGDYVGIGKYWRKKKIVKKNPILI